eukprot:CAMPEP_0196597372 /NCGR_PEP_ID=MMETSP1081-20130531/90999_1 /TAXON_ID=36882 /ORGANISM="Pyramimonas amylifera, Strain CCMP720" /LENGTH=198 /DNA_ID=CAMNT_0041922743 /DNA_START=132 /DNA_END=728 /DNA_ORIENTATION=+
MVWVRKWVDYSGKYGLGYLLSEGSCGAVFNDGTKLVRNSAGRAEYLEGREKSEGKVASARGEGRQILQPGERIPKALKKKMTILGHFESYLSGSGSKLGPSADTILRSESVFVRKWLKTSHAIIFRLSNKTIQVHFNDSTEIVLSSESRTVTYVNKDLQRFVHALSNLPNTTELVQRLQYTKSVLLKLISSKGQQAKP